MSNSNNQNPSVNHPLAGNAQEPLVGSSHQDIGAQHDEPQSHAHPKGVLLTRASVKHAAGDQRKRGATLFSNIRAGGTRALQRIHGYTSGATDPPGAATLRDLREFVERLSGESQPTNPPDPPLVNPPEELASPVNRDIPPRGFSQASSPTTNPHHLPVQTQATSQHVDDGSALAAGLNEEHMTSASAQQVEPTRAPVDVHAFGAVGAPTASLISPQSHGSRNPTSPHSEANPHLQSLIAPLPVETQSSRPHENEPSPLFRNFTPVDSNPHLQSLIAPLAVHTQTPQVIETEPTRPLHESTPIESNPQQSLITPLPAEAHSSRSLEIESVRLSRDSISSGESSSHTRSPTPPLHAETQPMEVEHVPPEPQSINAEQSLSIPTSEPTSATPFSAQEPSLPAVDVVTPPIQPASSLGLSHLDRTNPHEAIPQAHGLASPLMHETQMPPQIVTTDVVDPNVPRAEAIVPVNVNSMSTDTNAVSLIHEAPSASRNSHSDIHDSPRIMPGAISEEDDNEHDDSDVEEEMDTGADPQNVTTLVCEPDTDEPMNPPDASSGSAPDDGVALHLSVAFAQEPASSGLSPDDGMGLPGSASSAPPVSDSNQVTDATSSSPPKTKSIHPNPLVNAIPEHTPYDPVRPPQTFSHPRAGGGTNPARPMFLTQDVAMNSASAPSPADVHSSPQSTTPHAHTSSTAEQPTSATPTPAPSSTMGIDSDIQKESQFTQIQRQMNKIEATQD
ncbi:hypothetical protein SISNIDRAFT_468390 [Sistotremastrum niveocremeum HHB9708]|uniref:Uncharacterized protein n=1 Tax=Sistotremastrum niveocremeum HHB9708 TaxID=1314777 RepID=A0A164RJH2_9AGAM|nr:hypothetical protein SISNIDRAFT_468390 [Sistotremastrum niveocremeum HHB9708]